MDKKPLIVVSICAVVLLVLGSLSNVVGYQTVQTSQQNVINERINQKELLFQTIVDIANNKKIQRIILKTQMSRGIFPTTEFPVLTKNQLKQMYFISLILSKTISKSKIHTILEKYQFSNQETRNEITAFIEKNATLKGEITQVQNSECECENEEATEWKFPISCTILIILLMMFNIVYIIQMNLFNGPIGQIFMEYLFSVITILAVIPFYLDCYWIYPHEGEK